MPATDTESDAGAAADHDGGDGEGGDDSDDSADSGDGDTPTLPGTEPGSTPIRGVTATAEIEDGRVSMHARTPDAAVYLSTPNHTPLSDVEPVATLSVVGDGVTVEVELQADAAATLADALADATTEGR